MSWVDAGSVAELERRKKVVVGADPDDIVVWWHDGRPWAMANTCIHQDRKLSDGTLLGARVVCPGHQWAFELSTGHCRERDRCQPTFPARVDGDRVVVELPSDEAATDEAGSDEAGSDEVSAPGG